MEEFTNLIIVFIALIPLILLVLMTFYLGRITLYIKEIRNAILTKLKD